MRILKRLSIRSKLIAILLLLSIISLTIGFTVVITRDISTFKNEMVENRTTIARVIGDYSVVDLTFQDAEASKQTLAKLSSINDVDCAFLFDSSGRLFSTYARSACLSPTLRTAPVEFQGEFLHVSQPIRDRERQLGTIYLRVSVESLNQKINSYLGTMLSLAIALIILSFFLAMQLQRLISIPLIELAQATKKVTDDRDYSIRVKTDSSDEVGVLFDGFNRMLSQIEIRKEERDRAERALRESEYRYRVLVESSPLAIFLEQEDRVVYVNPAGLTLTGYPSISDLESVTMASLLPGITFVPVQGAENIPQEAVFLGKGGDKVDVKILSVRTTHEGSPATQYLIRDITESKNLRQAAQRMERLAALGEFSAMLAHEIRNSIGSVALNLRLLSERMDVPENYQRNFQNMQMGIQRIQEIIKSILDFARPATPKLQKVPIHKVLENSIRFVEVELNRAGIVVERQYDPREPELDVDVNQISQVFMNLYLNAKGAMDHGGKIIVRSSARKEDVIVEVVDTGRGIPREHLERIFDPFFTTTPKGVGLGLAFVSRILEQHNAQIFVESTPGVGTLFTIRFPLPRRNHGESNQSQ